MKKPIFTFEQRNNWYAPELEVAKMKFKREFHKSILGKFIQLCVDFIAVLFLPYR